MRPGEDDKPVSQRQFRRLKQKYRRAAYEKEHPLTPEQLARQAEVKRFNTLAGKWIAFENAFSAAPDEDIRTLCQNFPRTMAKLLVMARHLWTHATLEQCEAVHELTRRMPATFDAAVKRWPIGSCAPGALE